MALLKDLISALVSVALLWAVAEAPDPCCLRVTPYHIQALAQRMAQRFTALEYRAQDLRGVFASFQAVHGNVSHRLRYLEMEHAHLSEMVSRLDSRLQSLEEEKKMEEYRHRVGYYRAPRAAAVAHHSDRNGIDATHESHGNKPQLYKFYLRSRGRRVQYAEPTEERNEDPNSTRKYAHPGHIHRANSFRDSGHAYVKLHRSVTPKEERERSVFPYVRLRRNDMSIVLPPLRVHLDQPEEPAPDITSQELPPTSSAVGAGDGASHSDPPGAQEESTTNEVPSGESAPPPPEQLEASSADAAPVFVGAEASNDSAVMSGGTTPTPLWQLEESADALLQAMSAGDEDDVAMPPPSPPEEDESVSFWAPADERDSLEQLYDARKCVNCSDAVTEPSPATNMTHGSTTVTPDTNIKHLAQNSLDSISSPSDVEDTSESQPTTSDIDNTIPVLSTAKTKTGCQSSSARVPTQNFSHPSPSNETDSLMDFFTANTTGNGSACEGSGCEATQSELSDAELHEALRELDALLQRPPASAPPPDPEKLLLKRALKLALAALERTSDACLTLVNFTADAFEGLAAAEGMTGVASEGA